MTGLDAGFADVGDDNVHAPAIGCATWLEIARGVSGQRYAPAGAVTRAQMASFIVRMLDSAGVSLPDGEDAYTDDDASIHEPAINALSAAGIVRGVSADRYSPKAAVSRAQMATFLAAAYQHAHEAPLPSGSDAFGDDDGAVHEYNINAIAAAGIASGVSPRVYAPRGDVRRDQMASFLVRTLGLLPQ